MRNQKFLSADTLFSFEGRSGRAHYWLMCGLGFSTVVIVELITLLSEANEVDMLHFIELAMLWPGVAVTVKRWHDRGRSGWSTLWALLPVFGWLYTLFQCGVLPGELGPNQYGVAVTPSSQPPQPIRTRRNAPRPSAAPRRAPRYPATAPAQPSLRPRPMLPPPGAVPAPAPAPAMGDDSRPDFWIPPEFREPTPRR